MTKRSALSILLGLEKEPKFTPASFLFGNKDFAIESSSFNKLRENHYKAVGRIVIEFSAIEFFMKYYISLLLDKNLIAGKLVCLELTFRNLQKLLMRLFFHHEKNEQTRKDLEFLLNKLDELYREKRNRVVHDFWDFRIIGNKVTRLYESYDKKKKLFKSETISYNIKELNDIGEDVQSASVALNTFMMKWLCQANFMPKQQKRTLAEILKEIKGL
jgi:hypothetical protein